MKSHACVSRADAHSANKEADSSSHALKKIRGDFWKNQTRHPTFILRKNQPLSNFLQVGSDASGSIASAPDQPPVFRHLVTDILSRLQSSALPGPVSPSVVCSTLPYHRNYFSCYPQFILPSVFVLGFDGVLFPWYYFVHSDDIYTDLKCIHLWQCEVLLQVLNFRRKIIFCNVYRLIQIIHVDTARHHTVLLLWFGEINNRIIELAINAIHILLTFYVWLLLPSVTMR